MTLKTISVVPISRGGGRKAPSLARSDVPPAVAQPITRQAAPPRVTHRYRVGDRLVMMNGGNRVARASAFCKVVSLMPYEGYGALLYRVRSEAEQFERVVAEADLGRRIIEP
jgi:hypothetical protein